ncbi:MAG TPA: hypothetical protein VN026_04525 [Bacteroidia bacterium]|jgi:hypothetical protein|nr:hypothetical protein [Bacteroidia bacterium]
MIDRYLYNDIHEKAKEKCMKSHGGYKLFGFIFLSEKAKEEHKRIMSLPLGELLKLV